MLCLFCSIFADAGEYMFDPKTDLSKANPAGSVGYFSGQSAKVCVVPLSFGLVPRPLEWTGNEEYQHATC